MHPGNNTGGYKVMGFRIDGFKKPKYIQIHKMVATVYLGWYKRFVVDHKDGNKKNNNVWNLEWVTFAENTRRAYKLNLHKKYFGDSNYCTKYTDKQIHVVCKLLQSGVKAKEVSKKSGIPIAYIWKILEGTARTEISKLYKFPSILYKGPNKPLSTDIKKEILSLYKSNIPIKTIQQNLNIESYSKVVHAIYDE